jgi:phosphoribosylaminoimidazole (AIR) synthetase
VTSPGAVIKELQLSALSEITGSGLPAAAELVVGAPAQAEIQQTLASKRARQMGANFIGC